MSPPTGIFGDNYLCTPPARRMPSTHACRSAQRPHNNHLTQTLFPRFSLLPLLPLSPLPSSLPPPQGNTGIRDGGDFRNVKFTIGTAVPAAPLKSFVLGGRMARRNSRGLASP